MATECISREAAQNGIYNCPTKTDADGYIWVRTADVAHMIDDIPTADVHQMVYGKWQASVRIVHGIAMDAYECSVCGGIAPLSPDTEFWDLAAFCPHCGAVMSGKSENG